MKVSLLMRRSCGALLSPATSPVPSRFLVSAPIGISPCQTVRSTLLLSPSRFLVTTPIGISSVRSPVLLSQLKAFSPPAQSGRLPGFFLATRGISDGNTHTPKQETGILAEVTTLKYWVAGAGATVISILMFVFSQLSDDSNHKKVVKHLEEMKKFLHQVLVLIDSNGEEFDHVLAEKMARKVVELQAEKSLWYKVFGWK